jgi:hypothetical protein
MKGRFKLEGQTGLIPRNFGHQLCNDVALQLIRTENTSDNALNELFFDCDNDLYNVSDSSNVTGNLSVQERATVK